MGSTIFSIRKTPLDEIIVTDYLAKLIKRGTKIKIVLGTYRLRVKMAKLRKWTDRLGIIKVILQECLFR